VVITFDDVTERKRLERETREAKLLAEGIVTTVRDSLVVLDHELRVVSVNRSFERLFGLDAEPAVGLGLHELGGGWFDLTDLRAKLALLLAEGVVFEDHVIETDVANRGRRQLRLSARRLDLDDKGQTLVLMAIDDFTERRP